MSTMSANVLENPITGRDIKIGSANYKKLVKEGHIKEYFNPIYPHNPQSSEKVCCTNDKCNLSGNICCIHGDQRKIIQTGKKTYALESTYIDGQGNLDRIVHAWKKYCPHCVSKSHVDQSVPDRRTWSVEHNDGWFTIKSVLVDHNV